MYELACVFAFLHRHISLISHPEKMHCVLVLKRKFPFSIRSLMIILLCVTSISKKKKKKCKLKLYRSYFTILHKQIGITRSRNYLEEKMIVINLDTRTFSVFENVFLKKKYYPLISQIVNDMGLDSGIIFVKIPWRKYEIATF